MFLVFCESAVERKVENRKLQHNLEKRDIWSFSLALVPGLISFHICTQIEVERHM